MAARFHSSKHFGFPVEYPVGRGWRLHRSMEGFTLTLDLNIQQIIEPIALRAYEDSRVLPPELAHQVLRSNNAICLTTRRRVDFPQPDHIQTSAGGVNQGKPPAQE